MSMTVERSFSPRKPEPEPQTVPQEVGRIPRITRLMALAIKFEGYVRDGVVKDYAELARLGHVTRARLTQIMDLNLLAPDIQEAIMDLPRTVEGRDGVTLREMMGVVRKNSWDKQRFEWDRLLG